MKKVPKAFWKQWGIAAGIIFLVGLSATVFLHPTTGQERSGTYTLAGTVAFSYLGNWGLAKSADQVTVKSYIPPCDEDFEYCLFYNGNAYKGTNFESAGLRMKVIKKVERSACLAIPPQGFRGTALKIFTGDGYEASVFQPVGGAATGHYSEGALYRLFYRATCFEFETRIGESQYANYAPGSITKFTDTDRAKVIEEFAALLSSVTIRASGEKVAFPD